MIDEEFLDSLHNLEDKLLKQVGEKEINILLERLGLNFRVKKQNDQLLKKINNNLPFTKKDITDFILYPLMNTERKIEEMLLENIFLLNKININRESKEFIGSMILLEIHKFVVEIKDKLKLMRSLDMKIDTLYYYSEDLITKSMAKGEAKTNIKWIKKLLDKGFSIEELVDLSGLSHEEILGIKANNN